MIKRKKVLGKHKKQRIESWYSLIFPAETQAENQEMAIENRLKKIEKEYEDITWWQVLPFCES